MAVSTTTFEERIARIHARNAKGPRTLEDGIAELLQADADAAQDMGIAPVGYDSIPHLAVKRRGGFLRGILNVSLAAALVCAVALYHQDLLALIPAEYLPTDGPLAELIGPYLPSEDDLTTRRDIADRALGLLAMLTAE